MSGHSSRQQDSPIASRRPDPWETNGSILIERYVYEGPKGGRGVQWLVYRVIDGELSLVRPCKTLSEALEVAGATS